MVKLIKLTKDQHCVVDNEDFENLNQWNWQHSNDGYAKRGIYRPGRSMGAMRMHRQIMDCPKGMEVDHINGDKLDNRKSNLRICKRNQNSKNQKKHSKNKSGHAGIYKSKGKWRAAISVDMKRIWLGTFLDIKDAILARKQAEVKYWKDFAPTKERIER